MGKKLSIFFLFVQIAFIAFGQARFEDVKSTLIFKFANNIIWPNEKDIDTFHIGMIGGDTLTYRSLLIISQTNKIKKKPIKISRIENVSDCKNCQVLYTDNNACKDIFRITKGIENKKVLMITDRCNDPKYIMLNITYDNIVGNTSFQINKANIILEGLQINPELLLIGGTEVDIREIYQEMRDLLDEEKIRVVNQEELIKKQEREINKHRTDIAGLTNTIDTLNLEVVSQQQYLENLEDSIKLQLYILNNKNKELNQQAAKYQQQTVLIEDQKKAIHTHENTLSELQKEITSNQEVIIEQKDILHSKDELLVARERNLRISSAFAIAVLALGISIFIAYRIKKKANEVLEEKVEERTVELTSEIEQRIKTEKALIISEEKLLNIFNSTTEAIFIRDEKFNILNANSTFFEITGLNKDQLHEIYLPDFIVDKDFPQKLAKNIDELNQGKITTTEFRIKGFKNEVHHIEARSKMIRYEDMPAVITAFNDISERKKLEKQVYVASITGEENERGRIAKELHDGLGPLLSTCKIYLYDIKNWKVPDELNSVENLEELIIESLEGIKEISNNISPHILRNYGIVQALKNFAEKIKNTTNINIDYNFDKTTRFEDVIEITIYRVITELINNTVKYANASQMRIDLSLENNMLKVFFSDNGKGFEYNSVMSQNKGFGLINMQSRITSIGGNIDYRSSPGEGVNVKIEIELKETIHPIMRNKPE